MLYAPPTVCKDHRDELTDCKKTEPFYAIVADKLLKIQDSELQSRGIHPSQRVEAPLQKTSSVPNSPEVGLRLKRRNGTLLM